MAMATSRPHTQSITIARIRWHVNRSPAANVIKWVRRRANQRQVEARRRLASTLGIDPRIESCAASLGRDGYVVVNDILDPQALDALSAAGDAKLARADEAARHQSSSNKTFWTRLLDEDFQGGQLPTSNPFLRFALQPSVIGVIAKTLGELPQLDTVLLTLSRTESQKLSYSQLWHRDHDDVRTIKMFTYLTDVKDEADGPFTFLPGPVSDRFGFSLRSHRGDEELARKLKPDEPKAIVARRLTTFMVETSRCLHMGSRTAPGHSRLLYTASYITIPRLYPEPPTRYRLLGDESELTRAVLSPRLAV